MLNFGGVSNLLALILYFGPRDLSPWKPTILLEKMCTHLFPSIVAMQIQGWGCFFTLQINNCIQQLLTIPSCEEMQTKSSPVFPKSKTSLAWLRLKIFQPHLTVVPFEFGNPRISTTIGKIWGRCFFSEITTPPFETRGIEQTAWLYNTGWPEMNKWANWNSRFPANEHLVGVQQ